MSKKIISKIFKYAAGEGASGLSLETRSEHVALSYLFTDGENRSFTLPKKLEDKLSNNLRQILDLAPDELIKKKYCKISNADYNLSFHLTITPTRFGSRVIIKIVPKSKKLLRLNQLGLGREQLKTARRLLIKKSGLIIISSPDNQGKNTTLNALINEIDKPTISSYALGYKLEHEFANVSSLAANSHNWDKILSLDSEVIISALNSEANLRQAIRAAGTGRLVLGVLRADSSWEILASYLKLKMPLETKLKGLSLIINQRVLPLKRWSPEKPLLKSKRAHLTREAIALFEFLEMNNTLKNFLIKSAKKKDKNNFWEELAQLATKNNYHSLNDDYQDKKKNGLLT